MNIVVNNAKDALTIIADWLGHGGKLPEPERARIHALTAPPSQPNYELAEAERLAWAKMDLDARLSELVDWIKTGTPDQARARIHALTRKFTMTDEELWEWTIESFRVNERLPIEKQGIIPVLKDLRDRYEERGKYAPK